MTGLTWLVVASGVLGMFPIILLTAIIDAQNKNKDKYVLNYYRAIQLYFMIIVLALLGVHMVSKDDPNWSASFTLLSQAAVIYFFIHIQLKGTIKNIKHKSGQLTKSSN